MKTCSKCGEVKPATPEFFVLCSPRAKTFTGVTSPCRDCHKKRMKVDNRQRYRGNRARGLLKAYRQNDMKQGRKTTLTEIELAEIIVQPCHYCGTVDAVRGADRIDNSLGHSVQNCLPSCRICNMVRNNLFTVEEMEKLGKVIAEIVAARL